MAPTSTTARFSVTIRTRQYGNGDLPGFLDMLRYEGGKVVDWSSHGDGSFSVTIDVYPAFSHVPDRWRSFGIVPTEAVLR